LTNNQAGYPTSITTTTTLTGVSGRNVINLTTLNLNASNTLTLTAGPGATDVSWVINVSGVLSLVATSSSSWAPA
jgi:hypothetical protein